MTESKGHHILFDPAFAGRLREIDQALEGVTSASIPDLAADIPLDVFGLLLLECPDAYRNIKKYLPDMPKEELQVEWVGAAGEPLLLQSLQFVRSATAALAQHGKRTLREATVLDYGCGWGRILRLFSRFVPESQLYGMDAWQPILDVARDLRVRGTLQRVEEYPDALPPGPCFDLVYLFSIFTHLSERAHLKVLAAIHERLADDGVAVITVRPIDFWRIINRLDKEKLQAAHRDKGFAFVPHPALKAAGAGEVPYGDTSISLEYVRRNWTGFRIVGVEYNLIDACQLLIILKKA